LKSVVDALKSNPYLKKEEAEQLSGPVPVRIHLPSPPTTAPEPSAAAPTVAPPAATQPNPSSAGAPGAELSEIAPNPADDEAVSTYLKDNAAAITAEGEKPFQSIGGVVELLGNSYFPVTETAEIKQPATAEPSPAEKPTSPAPPKPPAEGKRENALQKINRLDVKGRIQLALKGNKEERSLLIRDGTKVVALAVLEAPKLSDGEVEKIASQKNVLEAVLRQIPLKRRFMKNYIVVRNLVANPRTPLDLGLGLMKNLLAPDLKNISGNKEVSETIRKLALKMYKQKMDDANKK